MECVSRNLNQQQEYINIFETAKAFSWSPEGAAQEEPVLGIALCGSKSWLLPQGRIEDEMGFLNLKGMLENLFARLGVNDYDFVLESAGKVTVYAAKEKIGVMSQIAKEVLADFDIKNKEVFAAEVLLSRLLPLVALKKKFIGLPAYPGILRDISFLVKEEVSAADIIKTIRRQANALLSEIKIVDYYKGKQIPQGFKGLTISCLYRSPERTLTEEEISPVHAEISGLLKDKFAAQMR